MRAHGNSPHLIQNRSLSIHITQRDQDCGIAGRGGGAADQVVIVRGGGGRGGKRDGEGGREEGDGLAGEGGDALGDFVEECIVEGEERGGGMLVGGVGVRVGWRRRSGGRRRGSWGEKQAHSQREAAAACGDTGGGVGEETGAEAKGEGHSRVVKKE